MEFLGLRIPALGYVVSLCCPVSTMCQNCLSYFQISRTVRSVGYLSIMYQFTSQIDTPCCPVVSI